MLTLVATLVVLFPVTSALTPAARAAEKAAGPGDVGTMAWTPTIRPLDPYQETVKRNLSTDARDRLLGNCWPGYLCVAAGQGDGKHTVWELYYCTRRTVTDFIDAGAMTNNQSRGTDALTLRKNVTVLDRIPADNRKHPINTFHTWYIEVC